MGIIQTFVGYRFEVSIGTIQGYWTLWVW
jgi:hypothetical protein